MSERDQLLTALIKQRQRIERLEDYLARAIEAIDKRLDLHHAMIFNRRTVDEEGMLRVYAEDGETVLFEATTTLEDDGK